MIRNVLSIIPQSIYLLFALIARICNISVTLFKMLAGITPMEYTNAGKNTLGNIVNAWNSNGEMVSGNFVLDLITSKPVLNMFWKLVVLAIVLLVIFTFVAIIKSEYSTMGAENSKSKILNASVKALFSFIFIPVVCIFGIVFSNAILVSIDGATGGGNGTSIANRIFICAAYNSNRARNTKTPAKDSNGKEIKDSNGNIVYKESTSGICADNYSKDFLEALNEQNGSAANYGIFTDKAIVTTSYSSVADRIDAAFLYNEEKPICPSGADSSNYSIPNQWYYLFGSPSWSSTFSVINPGLVYYYYDLWTFDFIMGIGAIIVITITFLEILLALCKRAIELTILFVISPPVVASMPLDNGAMFGRWKSMFIKKVLSTYAPVVAMNMYLLIVPLLMEVNITKTLGSALTSVVINISNSLAFIGLPNLCVTAAALAAAAIVVNYLFQTILIIAGALVVKDSIAWLSDLIGSEDLQKNGADLNGKVVKSGLKVASVAMPALKGAGFVAKGGAALGKLAGKKIAGGAVKLGGGIGGMVSGRGFKGGALKASEDVSKLGGKIKNSKFGHIAGNVVGGTQKFLKKYNPANGITYLQDKKVGFMSKHRELGNFVKGVSSSFDPNGNLSKFKTSIGIEDPTIDAVNARNDIRAYNKGLKNNTKAKNSHQEHLNDALSRKSSAQNRLDYDQANLDKAKSNNAGYTNEMFKHAKDLMNGADSNGSDEDSQIMDLVGSDDFKSMSEGEQLSSVGKLVKHLSSTSYLNRKVRHDNGDLDLANRDVASQENIAEKDRQDDAVRDSLQKAGIKSEDINKLVEAIKNGLSKDDLSKDGTYKNIAEALENAGQNAARVSVGGDTKIDASKVEIKSNGDKATTKLDKESISALANAINQKNNSGDMKSISDTLKSIYDIVKDKKGSKK
jgi:hypothetical protein